MQPLRERTLIVLTAILLLPLIAGCLVFLVPLVVYQLPVLLCQRLRAVRWLVPLSLLYCVALACFGAAASVLFDFPWWVSISFPVISAMSCLLPDPWTFFCSPKKRQAVFAAISHQEQLNDHPPLYRDVEVFATEADRYIVLMCLDWGGKPFMRKFVAVYFSDQRIDELKFDAVAASYDVPIWM